MCPMTIRSMIFISPYCECVVYLYTGMYFHLPARGEKKVCTIKRKKKKSTYFYLIFLSGHRNDKHPIFKLKRSYTTSAKCWPITMNTTFSLQLIFIFFDGISLPKINETYYTVSIFLVGIYNMRIRAQRDQLLLDH